MTVEFTELDRISHILSDFDEDQDDLTWETYTSLCKRHAKEPTLLKEICEKLYGIHIFDRVWIICDRDCESLRYLKFIDPEIVKVESISIRQNKNLTHISELGHLKTLKNLWVLNNSVLTSLKVENQELVSLSIDLNARLVSANIHIDCPKLTCYVLNKVSCLETLTPLLVRDFPESREIFRRISERRDQINSEINRELNWEISRNLYRELDNTNLQNIEESKVFRDPNPDNTLGWIILGTLIIFALWIIAVVILIFWAIIVEIVLN